MKGYDCVGVDIAKDKFDVCLLKGERKVKKVFNNTPTGFKSFEALLKKSTDNPWVCMEATGFYSIALSDYLHTHEIPVSVVNPAQVKYFSAAKLTRNKNDNVDADVIRDFACVMEPRPYEPPPSWKIELREHMQLISVLERQLRQHKNRYDVSRSSLLKKEMRSIMKSFNKRIKELKEKLEEKVSEQKELTEKIAIISSIKGIGDKTAKVILAYLPEVEVFSNSKQVSAYAGLSPRECQSGKYKGKTKMSKCGPPQIRTALFMPAMSIKQHNTHFKPFINRLKANGLTNMAIVGAIMRKVLEIIYGMLKNNKPFDPSLI